MKWNFEDTFNALPWGGRTKLAKKLGVKYGHLNHLANHMRYPSLDLAIRIERLIGVVVTSWGTKDEWLNGYRKAS
jgi:plasmid maintenance system antidote protein VapI